MTEKYTIYLDTSVISHLYAPDVPEKEFDTKILWEQLRSGIYVPVISPITAVELERCMEPKRSLMKERLKEVQYIMLSKTQEVITLAQKYIASNILTQKSYDDCLHMAYASVNGCDFLVSWNLKHMVNPKVICRVRDVNIALGYKNPRIDSPTLFLKGEEE